ncbi:NAD(P)H-dependent glycerol-3-phosphate dehydrogenase [Gephyromycinifex aptenodytis]|uniref:NAD(P)H-dependent glycerol-3-phosphate dehydrogenase n=1 Tax=Gephyromycinifex aptenodytis TaxID=2716227 RepID=UPI0014471A6E|nr:NAD(P)H-dependent glycerol-3-phosphate dehydrogenase [Gephyromycinifex aptenodytis]
MSDQVRVAVFGTGSWGTTFASVIADNGIPVRMWGKFADEVDDLRREHRSVRYLPDLLLPDWVEATTDPQEALEGADILVLALPAQTVRQNLTEWGSCIPADTVIVSLIKGIELGSTKRMTEVIAEVTGAGPERIAAISGPNLAKEIARREPSATVVACASQRTAEFLAEACATPYFRPYTSGDVIGCELGGSVKNVIALAVGMADGLGLGDCAKAAIMTSGLAQMADLGAALGADPATLRGLAGVGDLCTTCLSPLSRNQSFGRHLGTGLSVEEVVAVTTQTAEGVKSCAPLLQLARDHGVHMPTVESVVKVVHEGARAADVIGI